MERSARSGGDQPAHAARQWAVPSEALDELGTARATGALHVEGANGGSIYLVEGEVYYVHTEAAPGVDCLLQASGTVPASVFQTAWAAGAAAGQVGEVLIKSGALSRGEAELCTAAALTDGAFALLTGVSGPAHFAPGEGHWWGALRRVGVSALDAQIRKRRRLLEQTPPTDMDDQPVVAAARLGRHHVALTDVQWELIVHADGRRTPSELARLLGRSAFSAVLETRRLVAAGLLQHAPPAEPPSTTVTGTAGVTGTTTPTATKPTAAGPSTGSSPVPNTTDPGNWRSGVRAATGPAGKALPSRRTGGRERRATEGGEPARRPDPAHPMPLPRRQPGVALNGAVRGGLGPPPRPKTADDHPLPRVPEPDHSLLSRVRNALEGLR